ncbi:hypothetical protein [Acinetobacter pittii]|uniref:hypothetical protein n=1 Tax=Acinetobacter pittii TaxID=48296 RepID=UPI001ABF06EC|nr:hypothetical protein [Acinetobacter pittii]QDB82217.1 hypothetical protein APMS7_07430 [Acinetobacter pittii]
MSDKILTEAELSEVTLRALVNSLHLHGHDLDIILKEYSNKIHDNQLSGANASHKNQTTPLLESLIKEARNNKELNK